MARRHDGRRRRSTRPPDAPSVPPESPGFRPRLVVVFLPKHVERWADGPGTQLTPGLRAKFKAFAAAVAGATLIRAFDSLEAADAVVARAKAATRRDGWPTFRTWFSLELDPDGDANLESHGREIASWADGIWTEVVDFARKAPGSVAALRDRFFPYTNGDVPGQRHLGPASGNVRFDLDGHCLPVAVNVSCCPPAGGPCTPIPMWAGTGAIFGWRYPGGDGEGGRLADVEKIWDAAHTDFPPTVSVPGGTAPDGDDEARRHGTAVVVTACGGAAGSGAVGCAPATAQVVLAPQGAPATGVPLRDRTHAAILAAADALSPFDVLLVEAQTRAYLPVDRWRTVRELVRTVTAGNVIVVEAAGTWDSSDGAPSAPPRDLDAMPWSRDETDAIIVSAMEPWTRSWMLQCPYGTRVDCHSWGRAVLTSDRMDATGSPAVQQNFDGSSAAAAIVAGLALQITGIARKHGVTETVTPTKLRALLRRPDLGSPSCDALARPIGPMPDLAKLLENGLELPHLYLRGHGEDDGDPNWFGVVGSSPDLAIATQSDGSTRVDVRVNNRGRADAADAVVDLHIAKPSPVSPPQSWGRIGTSAPINVPKQDHAQSGAFFIPHGATGGLLCAVIGSAGVAPAATGVGGPLRSIADLLWHARALGKAAWCSGMRIPRPLRAVQMTARGEIQLWVPGGSFAGTGFRLVGRDLVGMSVSMKLSAVNAARLRPGSQQAVPVTLPFVRSGFTATHPALKSVPSTATDRRIDVTLVATLSSHLATRPQPATFDLVQSYRGREIGRLRIVI